MILPNQSKLFEITDLCGCDVAIRFQNIQISYDSKRDLIYGENKGKETLRKERLRLLEDTFVQEVTTAINIPLFR
tara:strand:+ start:474 stop:698 length:225 start_codon:yes stop_codon:yes gene_type:complete